jgi:hypothetical protein
LLIEIILFVVPLLIGMNIYNRNLYEEFIKGRNSTPLTELFKTESPHGLKMLLNNNGTFDPNDSQKTLVTLEDKMTQIYNALFVEDFIDTYEIEIGECSFSKDTKNTLFSIVSLLSDYADWYPEDNQK